MCNHKPVGPVDESSSLSLLAAADSEEVTSEAATLFASNERDIILYGSMLH